MYVTVHRKFENLPTVEDLTLPVAWMYSGSAHLQVTTWVAGACGLVAVWLLYPGFAVRQPVNSSQSHRLHCGARVKCM